MNDENIYNTYLVVLWFLILLPVGMLIFNMAIRDSFPGKIGWYRKTIIVFTILAFTSWLTSPWIALGLVKVFRQNWNAVNYVNRPDEVQPVPGKVYRADQVPK